MKEVEKNQDSYDMYTIIDVTDLQLLRIMTMTDRDIQLLIQQIKDGLASQGMKEDKVP